MIRRIIQPIFAAILILGTAAQLYAAQQSFSLAPGDSLHVTCMTELMGPVGHDTADLVCATLVPTATATATATNTPGAVALTGWHAPTDHEHGDAPPQWATDFSQAHFGHGIVYGGDEASSPMEVTMKEHVFKGIAVNTVAGGDVYLRYHAGSNPADRAARYHSFELYYRDTSGAVSIWQGWYDTGDPNSTSARCPRRTQPLPCENQRPIILVTDQAALDQGIRSGALPNYIAPTIAADARDDGFGNRRVEWLTERTFPGGAGIRLPN
jgi:hypothetical protein